MARAFMPRFPRGPVWRSAETLALTVVLTAAASAQTILGSMDSFAVMAGSTVTNTGGVTTINGSLGGSDFADTGTYNQTNGARVSPISTQNQTDFTRAFNGLAAMTPTMNLSGQVLGATGATTLTPGVYKFNTTAQLTGNLILDAQGQPNAVWVFQIGSTLTTAAGASVTFVNLAANSAVNDGVFWQVGTTTTVGSGTTLVGNFLGGATFDFGTGATIQTGRALTGTDTITLTGNTFNYGGAGAGYSGGLAYSGSGSTLTAIPEPSTYALLAGAGALAVVVLRRRLAAGQKEPARIVGFAGHNQG